MAASWYEHLTLPSEQKKYYRTVGAVKTTSLMYLDMLESRSISQSDKVPVAETTATERYLPFTSTPLGSLALEIRLEIYKHLFDERINATRLLGSHDNDLAYSFFAVEGRHRSKDKAQVLFIDSGAISPGFSSKASIRFKTNSTSRSIIFTCRQLYIEAGESYATKCQFFFRDVTALDTFSPFLRCRITDLCVSEDMAACKDSCWVLYRLLRAMQHLTVLTFTRFSDHALQLNCPLRNLRGLREVRLELIGLFEAAEKVRYPPHHVCTRFYRDNLQAKNSKLIELMTRPKMQEISLTPPGFPFSKVCSTQVLIEKRSGSVQVEDE